MVDNVNWKVYYMNLMFNYIDCKKWFSGIIVVSEI